MENTPQTGFDHNPAASSTAQCGYAVVRSENLVENDDGGCKCQQCGRKYKVDIIVPDSLWNDHIKPKDKPEGAGMLCGPCILEKIEALGNYEACILNDKTKLPQLLVEVEKGPITLEFGDYHMSFFCEGDVKIVSDLVTAMLAEGGVLEKINDT